MAVRSLTVLTQNIGLSSSGGRIPDSAAVSLLEEDAQLACFQEARPYNSTTEEFEDNTELVQLCTGGLMLSDAEYVTKAHTDLAGRVMTLEIPMYSDGDFDTMAEKMKYADRRVQQITLTHLGLRYKLLNVHCRCGRRFDTAARFRAKALINMKALGEYAVSQDDHDAVILLGDFNLSSDEAAAVFGQGSWHVTHIPGRIKPTGQRHSDILAVLIADPGAGVVPLPTSLSFGVGELSDAHGAAKVAIRHPVPLAKWTLYEDPNCAANFWWALGDPSTQEMQDYFLVSSAAASGWTHKQDAEGNHIWAKGDAFFYTATGRSYL